MKQPYQAVVVRYVHDVLAGEFLNIGVVLLCPAASYAGARFISDWSRLRAAFPDVEIPHVRRFAAGIESACAQLHARGSETLQPPPDDIGAFLAGVLPPDDSSIQFSPIIRGISGDLQLSLVGLHARYAERYVPWNAGRGQPSDTKERKPPTLDPEAPGLDEMTRRRRRVLADMEQMSMPEFFALLVRAGIYTPDGELAPPYRDDAEPSACRPTD